MVSFFFKRSVDARFSFSTVLPSLIATYDAIAFQGRDGDFSKQNKTKKVPEMWIEHMTLRSSVLRSPN